MSTLTVEALTEAKKLPSDFLRELGLENVPRGVAIPYSDKTGTRHPRVRLRTALRAKDGSYWLGDNGVSPIAYGVWRLDKAREKVG